MFYKIIFCQKRKRKCATLQQKQLRNTLERTEYLRKMYVESMKRHKWGLWMSLNHQRKTYVRKKNQTCEILSLGLKGTKEKSPWHRPQNEEKCDTKAGTGVQDGGVKRSLLPAGSTQRAECACCAQFTWAEPVPVRPPIRLCAAVHWHTHTQQAVMR
jgi:hypothetical protein